METKGRVRQAGQGMVEYIIIVALVALAGIATFSYFGQSIRGQTAQMAKQVAGTNDNTGRTAARSAATAAVEKANTEANLNTYVDQDTAPDQ